MKRQVNPFPKSNLNIKKIKNKIIFFPMDLSDARFFPISIDSYLVG